jgi:hemerythrin-like metal-binding protein
MPLINDIKKYKLGMEMCDKHHENFIYIINDLYDALLKGVTRNIVDNFLERIHNFTISHFNAEEDLMLRYKYPDLLEHIVLHKKFVEKIQELKDKNKNESIGRELITVLVSWLVDHISIEDKKYADFILKKEK